MQRTAWIVAVPGGLFVIAALVLLGLSRFLVAGTMLPAPPVRTIITSTAQMAYINEATAPTETAEPLATPLVTLAPEATLAAPQATPGPLIHIVQQGENLYRISLRYGVPLGTLAAINGITDTSELYVGQQLIIPVTPQPPLNSDGPAVQSQSRPQSINGVPFSTFVVVDELAKKSIHAIFARGQIVGNNPRAFSSVGDSTIEYPYFMTRFDNPGGYNLGDYAYLQPTIDYYAGSFDRVSQAVMRGLRASTALDPFWSDKDYCYSIESRIACEYRLQRPSVVFIRLGSNDTQPEQFDKYLRQVVEFWITNGVVPIMGTKADRHEGADNADNNIIRQIAADYSLPLWDFDLVAQTITGGGVGNDGVHLTSFYSHDYTAPEALQRGYGVHNLTALIALDTVRQVLAESESGTR
jgi:LysM repeat protein